MNFPLVTLRNSLRESALDEFDYRVMGSASTVSGMKSIDRYFTCGASSRIYEGTWTQGSEDVPCILKVFVKSNPSYTDFFMGDTWANETTGQDVLSREHDGIVKLLSAGNTDDFYYSVSEKIEGRELDDIAIENFLKPATFIDYMSQTANILEAVHNFGYVYGDLNTRNIMVDDDGRVRLIDFGQTREEGSTFLHPNQTDYTQDNYVYEKRMDVSAFGFLMDYYVEVQTDGFYASGKLFDDLRIVGKVCMDDTIDLDVSDVSRFLENMKLLFKL